MKTGVFILLLLLSFFAFCEQTGDFVVVGSAIKLPGEPIGDEFVSESGSLPIKIIISTDISGSFTFSSGKGELDFDHPAKGRWDIYLKPGDNSFVVSGPGFWNKQISFDEIGIRDCKPGDVFVISISGIPDNKLVSCSIFTNPDQVKITLDEQFLGYSENGKFSFVTKKGTHDLRLECNNYFDMEKEIIVKDDQTTLSYILARKLEIIDNKQEEPPHVVRYSYSDTEILDEEIELVKVKGGSFLMGNPGSSDPYLKTHEVELNTFYIGKFEVTQRLYRLVMKDNPSYFLSNGQNKPVETVSWYEAVNFCNELSIIKGFEPCYEINEEEVKCNFKANGYRLPTEAEWEYAARGGTKSNNTKYPGSSNARECSWYAGNTIGETMDVGKKSPNELGIFDMGGNVWEWCWNWYEKYPESLQINPQGISIGKLKVSRGGSWYSSPWNCSCSNRDCDYPDKKASNLGFRLVRSSR